MLRTKSKSKRRLGEIRLGETERAKHWRRWLSQWERSGLTQAEFCRRQGLHPVTFAGWKRKLRGAGKVSPRRRAKAKAGRSPGFLEVSLSAPGASRYEIVLTDGQVIRLPADFDPQLLTSLITAVRLAC